MINLTIENNPSFYFDYREGIKYLRELNEDDYEYPEEKTIFHVYSEFKNPKELMVLKSYLATQNLEKTKFNYHSHINKYIKLNYILF